MKPVMVFISFFNKQKKVIPKNIHTTHKHLQDKDDQVNILQCLTKSLQREITSVVHQFCTRSSARKNKLQSTNPNTTTYLKS